MNITYLLYVVIMELRFPMLSAGTSVSPPCHSLASSGEIRSLTFSRLPDAYLLLHCVKCLWRRKKILLTTGKCTVRLLLIVAYLPFLTSKVPTAYHPVRRGKANLRAAIILGIVGSEERQTLPQVYVVMKTYHQSFLLTYS